MFGQKACVSICPMVYVAAVLALVLAILPIQDGAGDPYLHYLRSGHFLREGKPQEAVSELRLAVEGDPGSSHLRLALGRLLLGLNRKAEGVEAVEKALELDGTNIDALRLLGQVRLQEASEGGAEGRLKAVREAEDLFKRALEIYPEDQQSLFLLIHILEITGRIDEAIETKRRLLTLNPTNRDIWISLADSLADKGDTEGELSALEQALELDDENAELLRRAGAAAESLEHYDAAFGYYDRAHELLRKMSAGDPDEPVNYLLIGELCLRHTGQYDLALDAYERAAELSQKSEWQANLNAAAAVGKATSLVTLREYEQAAEIFTIFEDDVLSNFTNYIGAMLTSFARTGRAERALAVIDRLQAGFSTGEEAMAFVKRLRAQTLADAGRSEEAEELMETLISDFPEDELIYVLLSTVRMQDGDFQGALHALERSGGAVDPSSEAILLQRSLVLERMGDVAAARATLEDMIEKDPKNHVALNNLGYLLAGQGVELDRALGYVKRALEMQPYQGSYLDSLGWIYFLKGDLERAERFLRESARTNYKSAEVQEHLGYLNSALDRPEEALGHFRAALAAGLEDVKPTDAVEMEIDRLEKLLKVK